MGLGKMTFCKIFFWPQQTRSLKKCSLSPRHSFFSSILSRKLTNLPCTEKWAIATCPAKSYVLLAPRRKTPRWNLLIKPHTFNSSYEEKDNCIFFFFFFLIYWLAEGYLLPDFLKGLKNFQGKIPRPQSQSLLLQHTKSELGNKFTLTDL